jgi:hypothetical protein
MSNQEQVWDAIVSAVPTVELWNREMPELVKQHGAEFKAFAQAEAGRRGYLWAPDARQYVHPWAMRACSGTNLIGCGWKSGQLAVIFSSKDGPRRYESVSHEVDISVANKLVNSPFPDKLYSQIVKGHIQMERVG